MSMNLKTVCRLCLVKSSKTSEEIFFPIDEDFERKFAEVTNIVLDVVNEVYPATACVTCLTQFEESYNYRKGLIENQKRLNSLLGIKKEPLERRYEFDSNPENVQDVVEEADGEESNSQNEEEKDSDYMESQDMEYQQEEDVEYEEESTIINYEVVAPTGEFELEDSEAQIMQDDEVYHEETEEYIESDEEYEMEQGDSEDRLLFTIAAESDFTNCIIVKTDEDIEVGEPLRKKRKYEKSNTKDRPYKCWQSDCNAAFTHRSSINKHMLLAHQLKTDKNTCMMCGRRFTQYSEFLSHVKMHTRKSECDICKLTFVTDEKMQAHRERVHKNDSDDRSFKCHVSLSIYLVHITFINSVHFQLCDAMFKRKEHLNSHITYRHTDQNTSRRFQCNDCPATFITRQDLRNHQKSHTQLKKNCAYCNYDCRDLKSIKLHCMKVHSTTKIYKCGCNETFELFKDYQLHKKNCYQVVDSTTKGEED
jgi:hypothetical protein